MIQTFHQVHHSTLRMILLNQNFLMLFGMGFHNTEGLICLKTQREKLLKKELTESGLISKALLQVQS